MAGKKGRSGRKRKYQSHPFVDRARKYSLDYYYKHREERKKKMHDYHKQIKDYADEHKISFEDAIKRGAGRKERRISK